VFRWVPWRRVSLILPAQCCTLRNTACVPQHPIAVSGVTADRLATLGPARETVERIRSIPPAEDGFDVLFAGRLIADRHVDRLLDAFDRLDGDATLGVVGDGPQRDALERRAETLDARDRITFTAFSTSTRMSSHR
jgi:glycosyltransferase involved in cell wall biosynthesis